MSVLARLDWTNDAAWTPPATQAAFARWLEAEPLLLAGDGVMRQACKHVHATRDVGQGLNRCTCLSCGHSWLEVS